MEWVFGMDMVWCGMPQVAASSGPLSLAFQVFAIAVGQIYMRASHTMRRRTTWPGNQVAVVHAPCTLKKKNQENVSQSKFVLDCKFCSWMNNLFLN